MLVEASADDLGDAVKTLDEDTVESDLSATDAMKRRLKMHRDQVQSLSLSLSLFFSHITSSLPYSSLSYITSSILLYINPLATYLLLSPGAIALILCFLLLYPLLFFTLV